MSVIIPRSVWEPRYANGFRVIGTQEWEAAGKETWLHHSVTGAPGVDATLAEDCAHMRHIESIGQNAYGGGISYTVVTMPSGRAFEGHSLDRQGSHTYGRNNRARAICMAGNYDVVAPGAKILGAVAAVLREWGCELDGGHRDVYSTACPGQYAYARIGDINRAARGGAPIEGDDEQMLSPEAQQWMRENLMGTVTVPLLQSMAARVEGLAKTIGEAQSGPDTGEVLQGPIDINETKHRVHDLMQLKLVGDRDRVVGEQYPLVELLLDIADRLSSIEARLPQSEA